eukprot:scaffold6895_cov131-Isochrysis_galbana.AAC.7
MARWRADEFCGQAAGSRLEAGGRRSGDGDSTRYTFKKGVWRRLTADGHPPPLYVLHSDSPRSPIPLRSFPPFLAPRSSDG